MSEKPNGARRPADDVVQGHTKMLRMLQAKTLGKEEIAERMTTTIETNGRSYSFETCREDDGAINTNIRTMPAKAALRMVVGEEKKERGA